MGHCFLEKQFEKTTRGKVHQRATRDSAHVARRRSHIFATRSARFIATGEHSRRGNYDELRRVQEHQLPKPSHEGDCRARRYDALGPELMRLEAEDARFPLDEATARTRLVEGGRLLAEQGFVLGTAGNVSLRLGDGSVLMTPSALAYDAMQPEDIVKLTPQGEVLDAARGRTPTSEKSLHLVCLNTYPEVGAVVHSHTRCASAFALAHATLPCQLEEMLLYVGGDVEVAEYHLTGSRALAEEAARHLERRSAVLLANHGLLTIGRDLPQALHLTALVERCAEISARALQLGTLQPLPLEARQTLESWYRQQRFGDARREAER